MRSDSDGSVVRPRDPWSFVPPVGYRGRDPVAVASDPTAAWDDLVRAALVAPELVARNAGLHAGWPANRRVLGEALPDDVVLLGLIRLAACRTAPPGLVERIGRRDEAETRLVRPFDPPRAIGGWEGYVWVNLPDDGEAEAADA